MNILHAASVFKTIIDIPFEESIKEKRIETVLVWKPSTMQKLKLILGFSVPVRKKITVDDKCYMCGEKKIEHYYFIEF